MKHITKPLCTQLLFCHVLVFLSVLTMALLGRPVDTASEAVLRSQAGWLTCPPRPACSSSAPLRTKRRQAVSLHDREYHLWCYIADSWFQPCLRSLLLAAVWRLTGHRPPAVLVGWPWLLRSTASEAVWLWQVATAGWPELNQHPVWRRGGWLLRQGQQLVVCGFLSLGVSLWLRQVGRAHVSLPLLDALDAQSSAGPLARSPIGCAVAVGCVACGRQEPWVGLTTEADGSYTATLCGHFTFHIAGDDLFQQRQAILFLRQLEGPGPQRSGRRTRDGRTPFVSQEKLSAWFQIAQPHLSLVEKYWRDKDWANLLSLKATEVLRSTASEAVTADLMARIVTVFVTFPWWGVDKVYDHLRRQGVEVTERQVRQAAEQSGWSQLRQALVRRYHLTAGSFQPRDNWLVADLLTLV